MYFEIISSEIIYFNNNNLTTTIYLKNNNEQLIPEIVTKLIEAGQTNTGTGTLEKSNKNLQIQTCKNFTYSSNRFKVFYTSSQNKSNTKWNNYFVSPTFLIIIGIYILFYAFSCCRQKFNFK